jgi:quercetin dioxygenase-like cupin family protein
MHNDNPADPAPTDALVVHEEDAEQMVVYSWARDGKMHSAWPHEDVEVPYDGTKIFVKIINFPIGSVREVFLETGARTHPHGSYEDVLFYQIGGKRVQMCETDAGQLLPGDASFEPHGVEHSTYQLIEGLFVEFALPAPQRVDGKGVWLRSDEARTIPCAVCEQGGSVMLAEGPEAHWAPESAQRYVRRIFAFPGHDLIETRLDAGIRSGERRYAHDTLLYVVSGKADFRVGGERFEVKARDTMRVPRGDAFEFVAREAFVVIEALARDL